MGAKVLTPDDLWELKQRVTELEAAAVEVNPGRKHRALRRIRQRNDKRRNGRRALGLKGGV